MVQLYQVDQYESAGVGARYGMYKSIYSYEGNIKEFDGNVGGSAVYKLGFVGVLVYFIQTSDGLGQILFGILKAILWPALVVYKVLQQFNF